MCPGGPSTYINETTNKIKSKYNILYSDILDNKSPVWILIIISIPGRTKFSVKGWKVMWLEQGIDYQSSTNCHYDDIVTGICVSCLNILDIKIKLL